MKYGRRPPKNAPALAFADFRANVGGVPAHPSSVDYLAHLSAWRMLGNDQVGDCNAVAWANMRRLVTANLSVEIYPSLDQVYAFYKTQNPDFNVNGAPSVNGPGSPADGGMDIQTGLEYLHKTGGPDGAKAIAFAKVDLSNQDEVDAAIAIFGGVWLGIVVLDTNMHEFDQGVEWTDNPNGQVDGGHAVLAGGYAPDVRFVTWAAETGFAPSFWTGSSGGNRLVEEAWVVVWPEHLDGKAFQQGVDLTALASAYRQLTGDTLPIPTPTPVPTPTPAPTPPPTPTPAPAPDIHVDSADRALAAKAKKWLASTHYFSCRRLAKDLTEWLNAKGL